MINLLTVFAFDSWIYYTLCAVLSLLVLFGIYLMSNVKTSVLGNRISAFAMLSAIIVTLVYNNILDVWYIYLCMAIGAVIGIIFTFKVKMIQMPQLVALLNGLGGASSALVGIFAILGIGVGTAKGIFSDITSGIAIAVGFITLIGSLVAAGKLHKILSQKPVIYKGHKYYTLITLLITIISLVCLVFINNGPLIIILIVLLSIFSSLFGWFFSIRVGGADMPITISLLNSLSGVAAAIAGLAISDALLVSIGGIVGASGLLLTQVMCKAMNRKLLDILLSKTSSKKVLKQDDKKEEKAVDKKEETLEETRTTIDALKEAKNVIIVPGYGMAVAQAQHLVKKLADYLRSNGASVKYAVHPVAGRMPGHMNVLLCEADVDYEDLYEMEDINNEFETADLTIVIGANDVLNPAAREAEGTPIYGMPILDVDKCKEIIIFNYDLKPGYAGVENPIYQKDGVHKELGNASDTIAKVLNELK